MPLFDIHLHTARYSPCSGMEPGEMVEAALQRGLDGIIITEHGRIWSAGELSELEDCARGLVVLSGQEVRGYLDGKPAGDMLVFGSPRRFPDDASPEEVVRDVRRDGGVVIAAHPYRGWLGLGDLVADLPLDALETLSGNSSREENERASREARRLGVPEVGGSDAHRAGDVGRYATEFTGRISSIRDVVRLVKEGCCRPVNGENA